MIEHVRMLKTRGCHMQLGRCGSILSDVLHANNTRMVKTYLISTIFRTVAFRQSLSYQRNKYFKREL